MNCTSSHSLDDFSDTFSSSFDQFDLGYTDLVQPMVDYGNSEFDNRHRVTFGAITRLPSHMV